MTDDPDTPKGLDDVRAVLAAAEDVTLPEGMAAPHPDGNDSPDEDPYRGMEPDFTPGGPTNGPVEGAADPDKLREAAAEPLNDFGNGRRFQIHFGLDARHVPRYGWIVWTGQVWKPDPDELMVRALAHRIGGLIERETQFLKVPAEESAMRDRRDALTGEIGALSDVPAQKRTVEERGKLRELKEERAALDHTLDQIGGQIGKRLTHAKAAGNTNSLNNLLTEAAVGLAVDLEKLDADPLAVNTESGILRFSVVSDPEAGLSKTATVRLDPHDRAALMTKIMPVRFDPGAPDVAAPYFQEVLERIQPEASMRGFLQRSFGVAATALAIKALWIFHGDGDNGKSLLLEMICRIFGTYAATASIETLTGANRSDGSVATPQLVPLINARIVRSAEPEEGAQWNEGLIKQMTGGDAMLVRPLFGASVEVHPRFKPFVTTNPEPKFKGTDNGLWGRIKIVPWPVQIPKEEQIPKDELDAALWAERDGIFAWVVQGLLDFLEGGLQEPETVVGATQKLRDKLDVYGAFLNDACLVTGDPADRMWTNDLVNAFHYWMAVNKRGAFKDQTVERALAEMSRKWRSPRTGHKFSPHKSGGYAGYLGIALLPLFKRDFDASLRDHTGRPIVKRPPSEAEE